MLAVKVIPKRELRNDISRVLREVEAGERFQITVDGRPVAELSPIEGRPRRWVPRDRLVRILQEAPLDPNFQRDVDDAMDHSVREW